MERGSKNFLELVVSRFSPQLNINKCRDKNAKKKEKIEQGEREIGLKSLRIIVAWWWWWWIIIQRGGCVFQSSSVVSETECNFGIWNFHGGGKCWRLWLQFDLSTWQPLVRHYHSVVIQNYNLNTSLSILLLKTRANKYPLYI